MPTRERRRVAGRSDRNQRTVVILAVIFITLIALGVLWGDYLETWMNGTVL